MNKCIVKVKLMGEAELPHYSSVSASGIDLSAYLPEGPVVISPLERILIPTGIKIALEDGYEAQIRPRSGLAIKHGITVLNTPGTIDSDYRGEIKIVLINLSKENFLINNKDRIAQMVVSKYEKVTFSTVEVLDETERGEKGFGSTGK
ncbi:MAG: dUTP diphosphatase [Sphaerochaetaceae bacterium]